MKKLNALWLKLFSIICITALMASPAFSASNSELEERISNLEKQSGTGTGGTLGRISDRITLSGALELDMSYADDSDTDDNTVNDSKSDLDIGTVQLGIEAQLHDYVTAVAVLKGESLDSDSNVFWDEAFFTFQKDDFPVYFVGGKRTQPFGVFESLFINDPITQELYEINETGVTAGVFSEAALNLDVSVTVYKGETLIGNVTENGFGVSGRSERSNDISSYIVSASISPMEGLTLSAFFNSEPGYSDRNTTLGGALHFEYVGLILDGEYIGALDREQLSGTSREYKECAWVVSIGYQIIDPLILALRYEDLDTDRNNDGDLEKRYGLAATYTLMETDLFTASLMGEYRHSEYQASAGAANDDEVDELFCRLSVEF